MTRALEGIRVLDLGEIMQGPLAAQVLGDFGADVVKVERGVAGDMMRSLDRDAIEAGEPSSYYVAVNRNKRSVSLNLKTREGLAALHRLLERADVLVHSYRPAAVRRLGLSYEELADRYPRLVYASASGFGETGPYAHKAGQDMLAQSLSGMARTVGDPGLAAHISPVPVVDYASGMALAQGILAALLERERSGRGQHVSVNLLDTAMALQTLESASMLMYGRETNWVTDWYSGVFETSDGMVTVLGLFRENALHLVCKALDLEDLSRRPEFGTASLQARNKERANELLRDAVRALTTEDAIQRFDSADLLSAPLLTLDEALRHPQVLANGTITRVEVAGSTSTRILGNPVTLSRTPARITRGVAAVGEHTEPVLRESGFGDSDINALRASGAIRDRGERKEVTP
ncbi:MULTISPECIES: CaiB/BaiF CoA transferase family protein [Pseudonocardia]|uniref:Crotonobetainyl-CoA:carnitine CoA-transferase CaiB-like acyl-CoA transferase n=1 Tax=Pseudonocardia kunmingensis TaxID=630975 RepID=A0A543DVN9_9PSEU|nr:MULTISPECIES: CaiB/BaiF CoA-transferase family protein [Pseudonocardia]OZM75452.1 formyl-CoA transferase [Pseudonocardia sp. MH-G8]TQM13392.1 crotonobetainyl-CoA:carnitine CoA-transferase CaiB-like acyl-CoA transferase [Pseudonocardia kunmingensis]